jgi:hypothetical protein
MGTFIFAHLAVALVLAMICEFVASFSLFNITKSCGGSRQCGVHEDLQSGHHPESQHNCSQNSSRSLVGTPARLSAGRTASVHNN